MAPEHQDLGVSRPRHVQTQGLQDGVSLDTAQLQGHILTSRQDVFDPDPFLTAGRSSTARSPRPDNQEQFLSENTGRQDMNSSVHSFEVGTSSSNRVKPLPPIPPYRLSSPDAGHHFVSNPDANATFESVSGTSKQRPPPLIIPDSPILGLPLFSAYPVVNTRRRSSAASQPPSSYKGKEREAYPTFGLAGVEDSFDVKKSHPDSDHLPEGLDYRRMSRGGAETIVSEGRRGSGTRISLGPPLSHSAHFARPFPPRAAADLPWEPQGTTENNVLMTATPRRQRAMTLEQHSLTTQRYPSAEARRRSVDQARHIIVNNNIDLAPGWLPPGALPAVNPASLASFELTAKSQYDALGVNRMGSPVSVIRVAGAMTTPGPDTLASSDDPSAQDRTPSHMQAVDSNQQHQPYTWTNSSDPMFTLQSISTIAAGVPLVSPAPSQRTSNPGGDFFASKALLAGSLGLTDEGHTDTQCHSTQPQLDLSALKIVTSRSPQLDRSGGVTQSPTQLSPDMDQSGFVDQRMSMPSMTETSSGAGTAEVLLSSASTSLSRSTKNGKDGKDREKGTIDGEIQILQDQHHGITEQLSRALESKLDTKKKRVDRRKYILVELVETEMAYTDHLRDLVHIYLPQLAALSIVTPMQHAAISRNLKEMLYFHEQLTNRMVDVLKEEGLGTEPQEGIDEGVRIERIARKIAAVFVEDVSHSLATCGKPQLSVVPIVQASGFDMYDKYCSGAAAAMNIIRDVQHRPEWSAFEKRCRIVIATRSNTTLQQVLAEDNQNFQPALMPPPTVSSIPSRLMLRDLLILPVQRICRYPLVLSTLVSTSVPPSPAREGFFTFRSELDVGVDVERAMVVMQNSATRANVANQRSTVLARTATIARRFDYHPVSGLGSC